MNTIRRSTYIWLALLGVAVVMVILASLSGLEGSPSPLLALLVTALYMGVATFALARNRLPALPQIVSPLGAATKVTATARKATQRARGRSMYGGDSTLIDIGLLLNEKRSDGRWDRQLAQSVSLNAGAIQPFVNIFIPTGKGDRQSLIEFELYDQAGKMQFSHQVEQWVRDGDNLILCDRQMPVRGNPALGRSGTWDLRVTVDGALVGMHAFVTTPADESRPQFAPRISAAPVISNPQEVPEEEEGPLSLEDLLREQRQRGGGSHS